MKIVVYHIKLTAIKLYKIEYKPHETLLRWLSMKVFISITFVSQTSCLLHLPQTYAFVEATGMNRIPCSSLSE